MTAHSDERRDRNEARQQARVDREDDQPVDDGLAAPEACPCAAKQNDERRGERCICDDAGDVDGLGDGIDGFQLEERLKAIPALWR